MCIYFIHAYINRKIFVPEVTSKCKESELKVVCEPEFIPQNKWSSNKLLISNRQDS
jgi:hypothetical protein